MNFFDFLLPTKKVSYQTTLSPQKVAQRLESRVSPAPKRKSIFDRTSLTYHGEITEKAFEIGRRSRGNKDHPPTAYGIISELDEGSEIEVNIIPNYNFKKGMILFGISISGLFIFVLTLFIIGNSESALGFSFFLVLFSIGFLANYLIFKNYNTKLSKDIEQFIDGKIIK